MLRFLSLALALVAGAAPLAAQWASIQYDPARAVVVQDELLVHQNDAGYWGFSAFSRRWHLAAFGGSTLLGTGERVLLLREGPVLRAWSALRPYPSGLLFNNLQGHWIDAELCVALEAGALGQKATLFAYSSETGVWAQQVLKSPFVQSDIGRSVFGSTEVGSAHGYSPRLGAWATHADSSAKFGPPNARGAALHVELSWPLFGPVLERRLALYSSVRNVWSVSPPLAAGAPRFEGDEQALVFEDAGAGQWRAWGCSVYTGLWVPSPRVHAAAAVQVSGQGSVLLVEDLAEGSFEVLGALPGLAFDAPPSGAQLLGLSSDVVLFHEPAAQRLWAMSGLIGGQLRARDLNGPLALHELQPELALALAAGEWSAFSSSSGEFAPGLPSQAGETLGLGSAIADLRQDRLQAYSSRWNRWTAGPDVLPGSAFESEGSGLVRAHLSTRASGLRELFVFDERFDQWQSTGAHGTAAQLESSSNLLLSVRPEAVEGWSLARASWSSPPNFALPASGSAALGAKVAALTDSQGLLWGFSALSDTLLVNDWPSSANFQVSGPLPATPAGASGALGNAPDPLLRVLIEGTPTTEYCTWLWSGALAPQALAFEGLTGLLQLDLASGGVGDFFLPIQPAGLLHTALPLPSSLPVGLPIWFQAVCLDLETLAGRFGDRAQPLLVF